ncbi:MAG: hypothetical protein ACE5KM_07915 [Planctomycetaceae bacterium]
MRARLQWLVLTALIAGLVVSVTANPASAKIDAVRGRKYQITKRHGPWMIMVGTFHTPPPERRGKGMTPRQAADELVYELRRKGIPAYAFSQKGAWGAVNTVDRTGQQRRSFAAYRGGIAVLAGNYASPRDKVAQATLKYLKRFQPKFLSDIEGRQRAGNTAILRTRGGGLFRSTPGKPTPFAGAHLTPNPLLSPAELNSRKKDPLLRKLNSGSDLSLLKNPGKYSLIVASFYGKSVTGVNSGGFRRKFVKFQVGNSLDKAGREAWDLAVALKKYHGIQAWVFHDHHKSVVTVGSFDSPRDRRIKDLKRRYGMKNRKGRLTAEWLTIPRQLRPGQRPIRKWIFDPKPQLIAVPQL